MKKITMLLTTTMLLMLSRAYAAEAVNVTFALAEGDTYKSGQSVDVMNDDSQKVATITFGETGGNDFNAAKENGQVSGFAAYTEGNGTNGNKTGGTFYTIEPVFSGTIEVAVVLNADKAFYIEEDGTPMADYNGIKVSTKYFGTYSFDVVEGKSYKVYCAGSKLGFYGFNYTYEPAGQEGQDKIIVALSFPQDSYEVLMGEEFVEPELTVDPETEMQWVISNITYSSTDESVATVDATTGKVTIVGPGSTTIEALCPGNDSYKRAFASYELVVSATELTAVSPYYVFNFSDFDNAEYTAAENEQIVNNMGILVKGETSMKVNGNTKTIDGVTYTKRLQLGGAGSTTAQNIHIKVVGPCQVSVVAVSGKTDNPRDLAINIAGTEHTETMGNTPKTFMVRYFEEGEADVYIYSKKSGINLYAVIVEEIAARTAEVTFNKYGMGTFCYENIDFVVPEGVQAATYALNAEGTKVAPHKLFAAGDVIPKDEAVVIKGEPNTTYTFTEKLEPANIYYDANNLLIGQETAGMIEGSADFAYYYYTLGAKNGVCGFYWGAADGGVFELGAHKAFLALEQEKAANVSIVMFDGTATGINAIQTRENKGADGIYNLNGQKVNAQYKGVVIVNGKKQIRK